MSNCLDVQQLLRPTCSPRAAPGKTAAVDLRSRAVCLPNKQTAATVSTTGVPSPRRLPPHHRCVRNTVPLAYGGPPDNLKPRRRHCTAASHCPASHPSPGSTLARETFTRRLPPRLSLPLPAPGTETDSPATQLRRGE